MKKKMDPVAVVGVGGIFPGASTPDIFFDHILSGKSTVSGVPEHRWLSPQDAFLTTRQEVDKALSRKAGFIHDFDFTPSGFRIPQELVSTLDPLHQLVLEAGRQAFSQCRATKEQTHNTGVILAAIALPTAETNRFSRQVILDDQGLFSREPAHGILSRTGVVSYPAAILARAMGFQAGSFTLDAACASSLFSIKLACEQLALKKADIMVAGGVSRPSSLYTQIGFSQLHALSPSGRCAPFDAGADGLVVGEGCAVVVLKRLTDAIAAQDKIFGVIKGYGVSNDIEGNLVGPASEGQLRAMDAAYRHAGMQPDQVQYLECHGSGTPVGDQVELTSIHELLKKYECENHALSIGSVKSTCGHLLTAAGATGFIKTIMAMNAGMLPPSMNYTSPAKGSVLTRSNIRVQTRPEPWATQKGGVPRNAAVSAFGFGGINAHMILEEYQPEKQIFQTGQPQTHSRPRTMPCAIVGVGTVLRDADSTAVFKSLLKNRKLHHPSAVSQRWRAPNKYLENLSKGYFIDEIEIELGRLHIPPNQMPEILVQHLALLKAADQALEDANMPMRPGKTHPQRTGMGCAIGIDFDFGATDFHLRWQGNSLEPQIRDLISPALDFNRTLGALGGIVASRVAREFQFGGPCFTLSAGEASAMKSIETGIHSLSSGETDVFLCGCVDMAGDLRSAVLNRLGGLTGSGQIPAEGAAAIVLKTYDQAVKDNDTIYAVVSGSAASGGDHVPGEIPWPEKISEDLFFSALDRALLTAHLTDQDISRHEISTARAGAFENIAGQIRDRQRKDDRRPGPDITRVSDRIGHAGIAGGMFSTISTAIDLFESETDFGSNVCVSAVTLDGAFHHLILQPDLRTAPSGTRSNHVKTDKPDGDVHRIKVQTNPRPVPPHVIEAMQSLSNKTQPDRFQPGGLPKAADALPQTGLLSFSPERIVESARITARAHEKFLEFSRQNTAAFAAQFQRMTRLAATVPLTTDQGPIQGDTPPAPEPMLDRDACLEYAIGRAGNVLGDAFKVIDTYPVRVRLPDEPLMLVDRIMEIQGEMLSMGPGKIITQHDVQANAWYLDGPKAPVCITIEAGQADLFLCAWLGIDHQVKGSRRYRLLDAKVTFHRTLPQAGETIEYHIEIDRFLKQGEIYLFFFHYKGYIGDQLMISMRDGCAGFFTEAEVANSGGIILKKEETRPLPGKGDFTPLIPAVPQAFDDACIEALRRGDMAAAFGPQFSGRQIAPNLWLPGGRMHLIDRVLEFDPDGGRFSRGRIVAESDIHPDDWFLTCHFVDDMVMPGTLMYECCAHALRVFMQRMGWFTDDASLYYDVLPHNESDLKCRGPVTPQTRHARYEIEIREMGYRPEPYVIADAHMFSDDLRIVHYQNMGMVIPGLSKEALEKFWS